ncbi:hypothetical protein ACH5A0_37645, partial [Kitasatospora sp. NPDC018614]
LMAVGLCAALPALTGLIAAGPAQAAPAAAAPAPCAQPPCEGADPAAVTSWAAAPRVVNQTTLPSGARVKLMAGKPSWDSATEYAWVDGQLNGAKGQVWLAYNYNIFDAAYAWRNSDHPRAHRSTSGTTGMFVKSTRLTGEYAGGCISDGVKQACVGGVRDAAVKLNTVSPCDPVCNVIDPATQDLSTWAFVDRPDYDKVTLPSGAWVQQVSGQPQWDRSPRFNWAEAGNLPTGAKVWLEEWQGSGRWGEVYTRIDDPRAQLTGDGSTQAFGLSNMRACVSDGTDTQCTNDPDTETTEPPKAPCASLPCEGIDPATVTDWMPRSPYQIEDANIYQ